MASLVTLPQLEIGMETAKLVAWRQSDGAIVRKGDPILEVETDKATVEVEAPSSGCLRIRPDIPLGHALPVGTVLGVLLGPGDSGLPWESGSEATVSERTGPGYETSIRASPAARRRARELGVDLASVPGSGPEGRVQIKDVEHTAANKACIGQSESPDGVGVVSRTSIQRHTARRLEAAAQVTPQFSLSIEVGVDELLRLRQEVSAWLKPNDQEELSLTAFLVGITARILLRHPTVNVHFIDGQVIPQKEPRVGVAVATSKGLMVPVVRSAADRTVVAISQDLHRLRLNAERGNFAEGDLGSGTFTISNLGRFGIDGVTALVNPPEVAILAVGTIRNSGGDSRLLMTLSVDHRALDGVEAARFLSDLGRGVEHPAILLT